MGKPSGLVDLITQYGQPWVEMPEWEGKHMGVWDARSWANKFHTSWPAWLQNHIYMNTAIMKLWDNSMLLLYQHNLIEEIKIIDGCWNIRPMRGIVPPKWSVHSWGLAVDMNAAQNPLGGPVAWSEDFLQLMDAAGWTLGANFKRQDPMHFQYCDNY